MRTWRCIGSFSCKGRAAFDNCLSADSLLRCLGALQVWHIGSTEGLCDEDGFSKLQQQVTCLSFSPFVANLMVVGHSGGLIAVYSMHSSTALMVVQVQHILL